MASERLERRILLAVTSDARTGQDLDGLSYSAGVLSSGSVERFAAWEFSQAEAEDGSDGVAGGCCPTCGAAWCVAHLDAQGNVFYALPPATAEDVAFNDPYANAPAPATLAETFSLHSRPAAKKVIYLDFDGHTTSGTAWLNGQTIVTPAYDTDNNEAVFSDTELQSIQNIWARVAEDFSPFDVNVTTEEPSLEDLRKLGSGDDRWGVRVVIGGDNSWMPGAGGVAYVGSFDWNSDTPCFVFPDVLYSPKAVAEATSHEVGHTLGLSHDGRTSPSEGYYSGHGSGPTGWAPIMGVGYSKELVQWSRGEYASANNQQDDLTIITTQNGFGYRPDDYGNTMATAHEPEVIGTTQINIAGVIETVSDTDVFRFYTVGPLQATITPAAISPNLDILAQVWDASGTVVQVSNPLDTLSASFNFTVASAGTYFLSLSGTGKGDPLGTGYTDYGSLGQYSVALTIQADGTPPPPPVIAVVADDVLPVTGNVATNGRTNDTEPTLSGTAEPGSTVRVYRDGSEVGQVQADAVGAWSFQSGSLGEGPVTFTATATDGAGNESGLSVQRSVVIDTTANPPLILSVQDNVAPRVGSVVAHGVTNDQTPTIVGLAEPGSVITVVTGGTTLPPVVADASGGWSVTAPPLAQGGHAFTATAVDPAGNASGVSDAFEVSVDLQPPAPPTIVSVGDDLAPYTGFVVAGGHTDDATLVLSGAAEAASVVTVYANGIAVGTTTSAGGTWSLTTSPLPEGIVAIRATAADQAGNVSAVSAVFTLTIDLTPPLPPSIVQVVDDLPTFTGSVLNGGQTNDPTPTIIGSAEAFATVRVFRDDVEIGATTADGAGAWSVTPADLPDGAATLVAVTTDDVGNMSGPSAAVVITVDTTSATPYVDFAADNVAPLFGPVAPGGHTNDTTPTLHGQAEPGSTVSISVGGTLVVSVPVASSGLWSATISGLTDGLHIFTVTAVDALGNISETSDPFVIVVDTAALPPTIASVNDDVSQGVGAIPIDGLTNDSRPVVLGTAEPGGAVTVHVGSDVFGPVIADPDGTWSLEVGPLADGEYAMTAQVVDPAGNVSEVSTPAVLLTVDTTTTAPTVTAVIDDVGLFFGAVVRSGLTNDVTPTVSGDAEPGSLVTVVVGALEFGPVHADANGDWTLTLGPLADGPHLIVATSVDPAGNVSPEASTAFPIVVDSTVVAPVIVDAFDDVPGRTGPIASGELTNDRRPTFSGSAEPGHQVTLAAGTRTFGPVTASLDGTWSITPADLPDGTHTMTARTLDPAGNTSEPSSPFILVVDSDAAAPVITAVNDDVPLHVGQVANGGFTNDAAPVVSGAAEPGHAVTLWVDGVSAAVLEVGDDGVWSAQLAALKDGTRVMTASAVDSAGNTSHLSAPWVIIVDTTVSAPSILTVTDDVPRHVGPVRAGELTNDATPTIMGVAEPGASVSVTAGERTFGPVVVNTAGLWSVTIDGLPDGRHEFAALSSDPAGNTSSTSDAFPIVIDTLVAAPVILMIWDDVPPTAGTIGDGGWTNDPTPTISGTATAGDEVFIEVDGKRHGPVPVAADGAWELAVGRLADGEHRLQVRAVDPAGNTSGPAEGVPRVIVDTVAPIMTSLSSSDPPATVRIGQSITLIATFSKPMIPGGDVEVLLSTGRTAALVVGVDGTTAVGVAVVQPGDSAAPLDITAILPDGSAQDQAGNGLLVTALPAGSARLSASGIIVDGAITAAAADGFSQDVTVITSRRQPASRIPVTFSTAVTGLEVSQFRLLFNGRSVSMRGVRLLGEGADYTLLLPRRRTRPWGVYKLEFDGAVKAENGAEMTEAVAWYWRQGLERRGTRARARAFARLR